MANRSAWVAGNGVGLTWTTAINGSDLASLAHAHGVLSSVGDIANGTNLDIYADISVMLTIGSATPAAGDQIAIYLAALQEDNATYGDGSFTSATQTALQPPWNPVGTCPLQSTNATTLLAGFIQGIVIPPGSFRFLLYNATNAITLSATAGNNVVKYRTYNLQLNN